MELESEKYEISSPYEAWRLDHIRDLQLAISRIGGTKKRQTELAKKQIYALLKIVQCWEKLKDLEIDKI